MERTPAPLVGGMGGGAIAATTLPATGASWVVSLAAAVVLGLVIWGIFYVKQSKN
jgi:LPXTG-motif cell wall-anchored protein